MYIYSKFGMLLARGIFFLDSGLTDDDDLNEKITSILDFVNGPVMTIIYAGLGAFLAIKGAMLGTQIVKAADEPQVRQEKINALKYLVIGVAIAFGVAFISQQLVNYFKSQFAPAES